MRLIKLFAGSGWTIGVESTHNHEFVPGTLYSRWGVALLYWRARHRLSVSLWWHPRRDTISGWSTNLRLWGVA